MHGLTPEDMTVEWMEPAWAGQAALDEWFRAWIAGFLGFFGHVVLIAFAVVAALAIVGWYAVASVRRRFRCCLAGREVEVEFATRGLFHRLAGIKRCPVFEEGTAIACARRCLDASYRRQWEPALPVSTRANGGPGLRG